MGIFVRSEYFGLKTEIKSFFLGISFGQKLVAERGSKGVWVGVFFSALMLYNQRKEWKDILKVKKAPTIARHCWGN